MRVPHWRDVPDHFVWADFEALSDDERTELRPDAFQQEALLAHTTNLYVIPDQFGVVPGHLLVLPKAEATSIAGLQPTLDDEVRWLLDHVAQVVRNAYKAQVLLAEHGECGCATNDQAHVHVLPIPRDARGDDVREVVDDVLRRRFAGITCVTYKDTTFTGLHDIAFWSACDGADVKGQWVGVADLKMPGVYPAAARDASGLRTPYVYMYAPGLEFVTMHGLRSQFAREVVARLTGLPEGSWDRRAYPDPDRAHMFATYRTLAPAFAHVPRGWGDDAPPFDFIPRVATARPRATDADVTHARELTGAT